MTGDSLKLIPLARVYRELIKNWPGYGRLKEGLAVYFWPQVAGKDLEKKTKAEKARHGILWIKCRDPALGYNLNFFKREILHKYHKLLGPGVIRSVRVITGEIAEEAEIEKKTSGATAVVSPPMEIEAIEDAQIRSSFLKLYRHLAGKKTELDRKD